MEIEQLRLDSESEGHNPWAATLEVFEEIENRLGALEEASDGGAAVATLRAELPEMIREAVERALDGLMSQSAALKAAPADIVRDLTSKPAPAGGETVRESKTAPAAETSETGEGKKGKR